MDDYEERRQQAEVSRFEAERRLENERRLEAEQRTGNRSGVNSGGCVVILAAIGLTIIFILTSLFASINYVNAQQRDDTTKKLTLGAKPLK